VQIDRPPHQFGQFILQGKKGEPRYVARLKLDQHIHIALRAEVIAQDRAEQRQLADVVATTEILYGLPRKLDGQLPVVLLSLL
jgi:hypothetical protein